MLTFRTSCTILRKSLHKLRYKYYDVQGKLVISRVAKLRVRRKFRRGRKQVENIGQQAEEQIDKNFFKRLPRLFDVRRFVLSWLALLVLLAGLVTMQVRNLRAYYEELHSTPGGSYAEGMIGNFTNANPLYATGLVDSSVSKLIFAGLLKYDSSNNLAGDLAEKWKIDETGKIYTVTLRPNLTWQDGQPLTAEDVVFTFQTIQNPDAESPLFASWRGITVKALDASTISFTLSSSFAPFVYSLTTGIVPRHSLKNIEPAQLRSSLFNTAHPIGAGPFRWQAIETTGNSPESRQQNIALSAFDRYHAKAPNIERFLVKTYADESHLVASFQKRDVNALVGLDHTPEDIVKKPGLQEYSVPLTAETVTFFKTDSELLKDTRVRQALAYAVSNADIIKTLTYPVVVADEPFLRGQLAYNPSLRQLSNNPDQAKKLLDEAGWKQPSEGQVRANGTTKLDLKLVAQSSTDNIAITQKLQKAWGALGISTQITLLSDSELQLALKNRDYDVLLHGISMGADPDVFAYWHSTQGDPVSKTRLNLSDYKSAVADKALEAGRNRLDPALRTAKYLPFLQAWRNDVPAIVLYQPRFLYITSGNLNGFEAKTINSATDRFANVENWMIQQEYTIKTE